MRDWQSLRTTLTAEEIFSPVATYVLSMTAMLLSIFLLDRYLKIPAEHLIGWGLLGAALVMNRQESFKKAPGRFLFIFTVALISLRYFFWRTFDTLIYTGPLDMLGMMLIYLAEAYSLIIHFLGMFISLWPLENKPMPLPSDPAAYPTVDILIPTYNESEEIVKLTVTAAMQVDYPRDKFRVYILDDGSTHARRNAPATSLDAWERYYQLKRIARDLGAHYLTREENDHAKAGNINHALTKITGDLILVLDCDHVPTRDILTNTAGWFLKDEKLFLVQTPHFFINTTTVEKNIGSFSNSPGENDMFYHAIQPGMDLWNASYFCGSAAVLRRKFLVEAGGIAGDTITEDAETSLRLHNMGYNSVYLRQPMICGLSPETFDDYIVQRTRWAQGMVQIFILANPLTANGLSIWQKLCYFNSCFFWFFSLARLIFYIGPGLFLILGQKVYHASVSQIVAYSLPHVLCVFVVMDFFYGKCRRQFFSEIYESVQSLFLTPAIISALFNPRKPSFKITPKGKTIEHEHLNPMALVFFMICVLNLVGIVFAVARWISYPLFRDVILIAFSWCLYNMLLGLITLGAFWERQQLRHFHRVRLKGSVDIHFPDIDQTVTSALKDLSLTGIGVEIAMPFTSLLGEDVRVDAVDSYGQRYALRARIKSRREHFGKTFMGIEFIVDDAAYPEIVKFVYGDSQRWADILEQRLQPVNSLRMAARDLSFFMQRGVRGIVEVVIFLLRSKSAAAFKALQEILSRAYLHTIRWKRSVTQP